MPTVRRSVALLGATGSIGTQTLDVLRHEHERFELVAISGGEQLNELAAMVNEFRVTRVGVITERHRDTLRPLVGVEVDIVVGDEGLSALAASAANPRASRSPSTSSCQRPTRAKMCDGMCSACGAAGAT